MAAPLNSPRRPPYKLAGLAMTLAVVAALALLYFQFHGSLSPKTQLTLMGPRSGLVMDVGSKVTYNGVVIGRVARVEEVDAEGAPSTKVTLDVNP